MYIVQIKNAQRFKWHELPETKCKFRSIDKAADLYLKIKTSPKYAGCDVRVWQTEAEHHVEMDN